MTRDAFMARLREGLRGLPQQTASEILADYETHFADGEAAGRSEAEVAEALGDPARLARELRAEIGLQRWETQRSPSAISARSLPGAASGVGGSVTRMRRIANAETRYEAASTTIANAAPISVTRAPASTGPDVWATASL